MTGGILTLLLFAGLLNGWMYLQQPALIFFPQRELEATPERWGLPYEDVHFTAADGVALHGWYLPHPGATRTLLFFHGNAGNISHRGESVAIFHRLGLDVFRFDYRGYGRSEGRPDEAGLYRDADAAWDYLVRARGIAPDRVVLFGRSLGGAVAAQLGARVRPGGVILESTFSSARDFAHAVFPLLSRLVVMRYRFDTRAHAARIGAPLLVVHSRDDEIVPFALGEAVYRAAREPKTLMEISGDHTGGFLRSQPAYEQALQAFIERLP
jgi:uncharacterized protein